MPIKNHEGSISDISSATKRPARLKRSAKQLLHQEGKRLAPFVYLEGHNTATREAFLDFIQDGNTWASNPSQSKNTQGMVVVLGDATPAKPKEPSTAVEARFLRYSLPADQVIETDYKNAGDAKFMKVYIAKTAVEQVINNSFGNPFEGLAPNDFSIFGYDRILPLNNLIERGNNFTSRVLGVSTDEDFALSDYEIVVTEALSDVVSAEDVLHRVLRSAMNAEYNPHLDVPTREIVSDISYKTVFDLVALAKIDGGFRS